MLGIRGWSWFKVADLEAENLFATNRPSAEIPIPFGGAVIGIT
jgi:hypothetical protein